MKVKKYLKKKRKKNQEGWHSMNTSLTQDHTQQSS
jgi:hypothetical protein